MDIQTIDTILKYAIYGTGTILILYVGIVGCLQQETKNQSNNDLFFTLKRINNE